MAMATSKGGANHRKTGKIYFYGMTSVFITAVLLSSIKFIPFLFMISFLGYYACLSGVRVLKLKKLHKGQRPIFIDWFSGIVTLLAGITFIGYGLYYIILGSDNPFIFLSIFFGLFTVNISFSVLKLFVKPPTNNAYWYINHINGMVGSYIAAFTAFSVTIGRIIEFQHWIMWVWPAILGVPFMSYWAKRYKRKMNLI